MKLLSPQQVAELTGLPYEKALALIKQLNHIQIDRRYYVSEAVLQAFLNPSEPLLVTTTVQKEENHDYIKHPKKNVQVR